MKWINTLLVFLMLMSITLFGVAAKNIYFLDHLSLDPMNKASVQRGAKLYFNYCSSCHGLRYETYQHVAKLTGVDTQKSPEYIVLIQQAFLFDPHGDITQPIVASINDEDAKVWFGVVPPDLTNYTLLHSPTYLYNFLRAFYRKDQSATGSDNVFVPHTLMPNALLPLRGETLPVFGSSRFDHFVTTKPGQLKPLEFDRAVYDLVNFLDVVAEPSRIIRIWIGIAVLALLFILILLVYVWRSTFSDKKQEP